MVEQDIPKRVVIVLLVLTIIVSFLGTLTFIEMYNSMPKEQGAAQGTVRLNIQSPASGPQETDSVGTVSLTIKK